MTNVFSEAIRNYKKHRSAAKFKLAKLGAVSLGNIHEYEKQLRIIQACNNKIKLARAANSKVR